MHEYLENNMKNRNFTDRSARIFLEFRSIGLNRGLKNNACSLDIPYFRLLVLKWQIKIAYVFYL